MASKTYRANSIKEAIGQVKATLGADAMILSTKRVPRGPQNPYGKDIFEITAAAQDDMSDLLQTASDNTQERRASWIGEPSIGANASDWRDIQTELSEIKDMLLISNRTGGIPQLLGLHPTCLNLYSKLLTEGISERRVWGFMHTAGAFESKRGADPEAVTKNVVKAMMGAVAVAAPFSGKDGGRYVAAFAGPTGVGKTTTIAKLSAELSLKQKKKVGIISADSYRIGAVDQLKTYAAIMGLPCLSAFTTEDLAQALRKLEGRDVILIDTAGQSHRDMNRLQELGDLLGNKASIHTHLVLSATMKPEDMKEAATNFSILKPSSYVFTKVDETRTRGGIIDQLLDLKLPVSYITNGQRVPEDIVAATQRRVLKLILQGSGLGDQGKGN